MEDRLWQLMLENAKHIQIINSELSDVVAQLTGNTVRLDLVIKMIMGLFGALGGIFLANLFHIKLTTKNSKK